MTRYTVGQTLYRAEYVPYGRRFGEDTEHIEYRTVVVTKVTPSGAWVRPGDWHLHEGRDHAWWWQNRRKMLRFVLEHDGRSRKRWAYATKELAKESLLIRTRCRVYRLEQELGRAIEQARDLGITFKNTGLLDAGVFKAVFR
jgi:hypothetical protein